MRSKLLVIVAVASLALNVAVVGSFIYVRYRHEHGHERGFPGLDPRVMEQVRALREQGMPARESLMDRMMADRHALLELAQSPQPDERKIDSICNDMGQLHAQIEKQGFMMSRRVLDVLPPAMKQRYIELLQARPEGGFRGMRRMMRDMGPGGGPQFGAPPPEPPESGR